jgi:hypothetical protein
MPKPEPDLFNKFYKPAKARAQSIKPEPDLSAQHSGPDPDLAIRKCAICILVEQRDTLYIKWIKSEITRQAFDFSIFLKKGLTFKGTRKKVDKFHIKTVKHFLPKAVDFSYIFCF